MRLVRIAITGELLHHIMTNGLHTRGFRVEGGLPEGARFAGSTWDEAAGIASLAFEHESFAEHKGPCDSAPLLKPRITLDLGGDRDLAEALNSGDGSYRP